MAKPRNSTEAIAARLITEAPAIFAIVGNRITPNAPTQEESQLQRPYVAFWRISGGGTILLTESPRLSNYQYRVECVADTDAVAELLMDAVADRLFGNSRSAIAPWVDRTNGIQCCRPASDRDSDQREDGSLTTGQTLSLWFCPQPA